MRFSQLWTHIGQIQAKQLKLEKRNQMKIDNSKVFTV
jgi:hypothetical protein